MHVKPIPHLFFALFTAKIYQLLTLLTAGQFTAHDVLRRLHADACTIPELNGDVDSENNHGGSSTNMYYIGLEVHKKTISYCVKDARGRIQQQGGIPATRTELDSWMKTLPQP